MTIQQAIWLVVPTASDEIEAIRKKCRRLVLRRAALSAGVAALPVPGLDIATDLGLLASLIEDINHEFHLTPAQLNQLQPKLRVAAYEIIVGMGTVMAGKVITHALVSHLLQRMGLRFMLKHSARIVPIAGQITAAAIGFAAFRSIGNQHIDACVAVLAELQQIPAA